MIKILDDKTLKFIDWLNKNYGTDEECILSVFNCQDCICVSEDGQTEQSCFIADADLIMFTTENPIDGLFDYEGNVLGEWYEKNYTLIKLAHEYAHFLQKYGKLPNSEDLDFVEHTADEWAQKVVEDFINENS